MNSLRIVNGERADDGQITKRRYSLWTAYDCNAYSKSPWKRIPIEVWEEIKNQDEINILHNLQYGRTSFNMAAGNPILKETFSVRNSGGKTYLVTIKE